VAKKTVNVGMIGAAFMGKAHSVAYRDVAFAFPDVKAVPVMKEIAAITQAEADREREHLGWERASEGFEGVIAAPDIDLIDICTGNNTHKNIAIAAAKAGKHIFCEKPLAMNAAECREMIEAVEKAGVVHMVDFNYRRMPAVELAKRMIDEGAIGTPYHWRATYLQDWIMDPNFPLVWRLKKELSGSGAHGDLNAHLIDLARYLVGEFDSVCGMMKTFIKERPELAQATGGLSAEGTKQMGEVTVDDATLFLAEFKNGAVGTFESTRFSGNRNGQRFEINGSNGSLRWNVERLNELDYWNRNDPAGQQGWKTILVTDAVHPWASGWWPSGHIIGWQHSFVHQIHMLMEGIAEGKSPAPNFYDGLKCQEVLDAVEKSAETRQWTNV
jgi:predicted dehydrogenase